MAKYNLGKDIDPSGLISFDLYKEGSIDQATDIEKKYVGLVRDLHIFGCQNEVIKYQDRMRKGQNIPVDWADLNSNIYWLSSAHFIPFSTTSLPSSNMPLLPIRLQ